MEADKSKEKEVALTYDTIFELLRRERNRPDLQQMPDNFFVNAYSYIKEKKSFAIQNTQDMFSSDEYEKTKIELINILKMIRTIYNLREQKLLMMAVNKAKVESSVINTSAMLPEEKIIFEEMTVLLKKFRGDLLGYILDGKLAESRKTDASEAEPSKEMHADPEIYSESEVAAQIAESIKSEVRNVEFTEDVTKFVGPELEFYGPFQKGDKAELPLQIVSILLGQNKAKEV